MKKAIFFCLFAFVLTFSFASEINCVLSCDAPANVTIVSQSANSISFDWDDCASDCSEYVVWYVRQDGYTGNQVNTSDSAVSFSGLIDGTYDFYFRTVCTGGVSSIIGVEEIVMF